MPIPGGQKQLLNNVFGYVKPGTLTALMGASGAGKTTLLDVLAARKNTGVIDGDILIGAKPVDVSFARGCAYAEQLVSVPFSVLAALSPKVGFCPNTCLHDRTSTSGLPLFERHSDSQPTSDNLRKYQSRKRTITVRISLSCSSCRIWQTR